MHNTNLVYLEKGQAYKEDFMPLLPYALTKHKVLFSKAAMVKDLQPQQLGENALVDTTN